MDLSDRTLARRRAYGRDGDMGSDSEVDEEVKRVAGTRCDRKVGFGLAS